jgi:hypothetical protein
MARIAGVTAGEGGPLMELTHVVALENLRGRFNLALGIGAAGFSEGMACVAPATIPDRRLDTRSVDGESAVTS